MFKLIREDLNIITDLIEPGSTVLDIGCGDGQLLSLLRDKKNVIPYGIEINENEIAKCLAKGLSVFQGDIDNGLVDYRDNSFDYVILSQTVQTTKNPGFVIKETLRVGKKSIVSFPNFGYLGTRLALLIRGRMPRTRNLPYHWYDTPNIHHLTIRDFYYFCRKLDIKILKKIFLKNCNKKVRKIYIFPNLFADSSIFILSKNKGKGE